MKIAFVSQPMDQVLPPHQNSVGIWTYEVARRLAKKHQVIVYINGGQAGRPTLVDENVAYRRIQMPAFPLVRKYNTFLSRFFSVRKPFFASPLYSFDYALQVALDLRKAQCGIIHIQNFSQFVPIIRAFNPSAMIVLHMHCEWLSQLDYDMIQSRLKHVNLVLGCSDHIVNKVRERFPALANRCQTVYNGVNINQFAPALAVPALSTAAGTHRTPRLLFLGRISPEKGVHTLIEAFKIVARSYPEVELALIGSSASSVPLDFLINLSDDPQINALTRFYHERYIDTLKHSLPVETKAQVLFLGHLQHGEIPGHIQRADIIVNPSLSEAFGMSLIEAMATSKPVVATAVGGMQEIVEDGKTGLLVPPEQPDVLAAAILRLLDDPALRQQMGQAGYERVRDLYSWEPITTHLMDLYQQLALAFQPSARSRQPLRLNPK